MKVKDLIIKLANGEIGSNTYIKIKKEGYAFPVLMETIEEILDFDDFIDFLNYPVKIIEVDKEIEKINSIKVPTISNSREKNIENIKETLHKYWFVIDELTEAVNELKKGK